MGRREAIKTGVSTLAAVSVAGCIQGGGLLSSSDTKGKQTSSGLVVGSKNFTENKILGYMAYEAIKENTELGVVDEMGYGPTSKVWEGLNSSKLDVYWDYTGTLWLTHPPQHSDPIPDPQKLWESAKQDASEEGIKVYNRAPFNNTYTLLAKPEWIEKTGVKTITDLAKHINSGNTDTTVFLGPSFHDRPDGWPGLLKHYGFKDEAVKEWEEKGNIYVVSLGLTYEFLETGDADVAMGFMTDPQIAANDLKPLEDDKDFWPIYNPVPMTRNEVAEKYSQINDVLNKLGPAIGGVEKMRELNGKVDLEGGEPQKVARNFLSNEGVI